MNSAVTLTLVPASTSRLSNTSVRSPFVLVTGILTLTLGAQVAMRRAWSLHLGEVVGEHFERDGAIGHDLEDLVGEGLVVLDAGLAHERRIGGETRDARVGGEPFDAGAVSAIGEDLDLRR